MKADWFDFLSDAVGEILRDPRPESFLAWMHAAGVDQAAATRPTGADTAVTDEAGRRRLATALALAVWNAVPLPGNSFRPQAVPGPERNAPCPCGSGAKYKKCCGAEVPRLPAIEPFAVWLALIDRLGEAELAALAATRSLPPPILGQLARTFLEAGGAESTLALLEPFLEESALLPERFEEIVDPLVDATEASGALDTEERDALFASLRERLPADSRAALELRLASGAIDRGDLDEASEALARARVDAPDHPGLGGLEVQLLVAGERFDEARERAREWGARLARRGYRSEEAPRPFLARAAEDPERAVALYSGRAVPADLEALAALVQSLPGRELPALAVRGDADLPGSGALESDLAQLRLEADWRERWPLVKPAGTQLALSEGEDPWDPEATAGWLAFLGARPAAFDSLSILDDLVLGLDSLEQSQSPWVDRELVWPLLERATAIVDRALSGSAIRELPWAEPENRQALRLLVEAVFLLLRDERLAAAAAAIERYLELNPSDDHELRGDLTTLQLRRGENEAALALTTRLSDDDLPEICYGRVLALLRLGRRDEAERELVAALATQPHVPQALLQPSDDPPPPDEPEGEGHVHDEHCDHDHDEEDEEGSDLPAVERGSPLEAWYYAEEALALWSVPADALEWLHSHALPRG